jgi:prepilin peptidase CpaA
MMLDFVVLIACPSLFAIGAMSDLVSYRIPNWISLAIVAAFAVAVLVAGMPLASVGWHLLIGIGALAAGFALFAFNLIGGGDAKLFAAGALWAGPDYFMKYCLAFALVGGAFALAVLVLRRLPLPAMAARLSFLNQLLQPKAGLPYGVALGIGALIFLFDPHFMQALAT